METVKAHVIHKQGPPSVLKWQNVELTAPGPNEVQIRHSAVGLNFTDIYQRSGQYPAASLPFVPGQEAAGTVTAVGKKVKGFRVGDRVVYASMPMGAYSEARNMPAGRVVKLPKGIDEQAAAAVLLKGMTAHYLIRDTHKVKAGDTILVHAAAGGVGVILCSWAKQLGATVIGTVSSAAKARVAKAHGCDHVIDYSRHDFADRTRKITKGRGVDVVYDSIAKATFPASLDCLRPRGLFVLFGNASGNIEPFDAGILAAKGSLFMTRPTLRTYNAADADVQRRAKAVFARMADGTIPVEIGQTYALKDAAKAHRDMAGRKTTGSTVMLP